MPFKFYKNTRIRPNTAAYGLMIALYRAKLSGKEEYDS